MDRGHELTEEQLKKLEGDIAREYRQATNEVRKKFEAYMRETETARQAQEALLKAGKITQKEYSDWCFRHYMVGARWEAMRDTLAHDFHNANNIARDIARGRMPDVYSLNANFATYQIEHDGKIDTGFTLYNHDTAEYLLTDERELMPGPSTRKQREIAANKDLQWNRQHIQSAVLQGVLQGESPRSVARRLMQVGTMNYHAAVRYARTMTTNAQNAGRYQAFRRAEKLGVDLTIEWEATLDGRTRHEHRMMHGQRRKVGEPFEIDGIKILWPAQVKYGSSNIPQEMIWNCRCTLLSWVKGFEGETVKSSPKMGDMTFEEWQQAKPQASPSADREQFDRYHKVLGSLSPADIASFQNIKYNDPDAWKTLKSQYRIVNQYKVDSGHVSPRDILWLDERTISEKRTQFASKYKRSGNVAGAFVDGKRTEMFFAHSLMGDSAKGYKGTSTLALVKPTRRFKYIDVLTKSGEMRTDTYFDTEAKLFELFADMYDKKPFKTITMLSERGMCASCMGVMEQFKELYPDVTINVVSNKRGEGDVWKHRWRRK